MTTVSQSATDKELFELSVGGNSEAFSVLGKRYDPKLKAIFNKSFKSIENRLSYSVNALFEDFKSMVLADLLIKPIANLSFDENGSIGGLIDTIAKDRVHSMYTRTENHRSKDSTATRKKKALSEKQSNVEHCAQSEQSTVTERNSLKGSFDFGFSEFDENEIDGLSTEDPEIEFLAEDLRTKIFDAFTMEQRKIIELRSQGYTQKEMAQTTGLTHDQVRTQLKKIDSILDEVKRDNPYNLCLSEPK